MGGNRRTNRLGPGFLRTRPLVPPCHGLRGRKQSDRQDLGEEMGRAGVGGARRGPSLTQRRSTGSAAPRSARSRRPLSGGGTGSSPGFNARSPTRSRRQPPNPWRHARSQRPQRSPRKAGARGQACARELPLRPLIEAEYADEYGQTAPTALWSAITSARSRIPGQKKSK